jgi:hypothetical protein
VLERTTVKLDEKGWKALFAEAAKFLERVDRIGAAATRRLTKVGSDGAIDASVVLRGFEAVSLADPIPNNKSRASPYVALAHERTGAVAQLVMPRYQAVEPADASLVIQAPRLLLRRLGGQLAQPRPITLILRRQSTARRSQ